MSSQRTSALLCNYCVKKNNNTTFDSSATLNEHKRTQHDWEPYDHHVDRRADISDKKIVQLIRQGESLLGVSRIFGVTTTTIAHRLARMKMNELRAQGVSR